MSDMDIMLKTIWSDEEVYKMMWFKPTFDVEEGKQRLYRSVDFQTMRDGYFVALKDTDEPIGLCAIKEPNPKAFEESGICIARKYQGKGYGKELMDLLLDLAFNKYNAESFSYALMKNNDKSRGLKNKFNFKYVRTTVEVRPWDNKEFELEYFILSKEDYMKQN